MLIKDRKALEFVGLLDENTPPDVVESYNHYTMNTDQMRKALGVSKTVFSRFYVTDIDASSGEVRHCPVVVARYIERLLKKRGRNETLSDFARQVMSGVRLSKDRSKASNGKEIDPLARKIPSILDVINNLTATAPKAREAFERELRKINVFLPPKP